VTALLLLLLAGGAAAQPAASVAAIDRTCQKAARSAARSTPQVFDTFSLWRAPGAVVVKMSVSPPSGDWVQEVVYCFAAHGPLLRVESTLGTLQGYDPSKDVSAAVSRIRVSHFAADGRVLRTTTRVLDATTGRPAPQLQYLEVDEPLFKTLKALPFIALVK